MTSTLRYRPDFETYECSGCLEVLEMPRAVKRDPERTLMWKEVQEQAHSACREILVAELAARRLRAAWGLPVEESARQ